MFPIPRRTLTPLFASKPAVSRNWIQPSREGYKICAWVYTHRSPCTAGGGCRHPATLIPGEKAFFPSGQAWHARPVGTVRWSEAIAAIADSIVGGHGSGIARRIDWRALILSDLQTLFYMTTIVLKLSTYEKRYHLCVTLTAACPARIWTFNVPANPPDSLIPSVRRVTLSNMSIDFA